MAIEINILAVVVAGVTTMVTGYAWYSSHIFGNTWIRLAKIDTSRINSKTALISAALSLLIMAYALAVVAYLFHNALQYSFMQDTLLAGLLVWGCFQALRMLQLAEFNQDSRTETAIHIGNELLTIIIIALIIGAWGY